MRIAITAVVLFTLAVGTSGQQAATHFDGKTWWEHVKFLADDSLEGRDTGSEGIKKAQAYAVEQFKKAGLAPAGTEGFYQPVAFMQYQVDEAKSSLTLMANGKSEAISFADDGFISTRLTHKSAELTAPLVFVDTDCACRRRTWMNLRAST